MADLKQFQDLPDMSNEAKQRFNDLHAQGEAYVRENPSQAILSAVAAGFVLRLLPLGGIISGLVRLALFALRPAIFIYGAVALYRQFQEQQGHQNQQ